ncbi:MAG: Rne/Rng family ribonuclease, partial [Myxococcota bacterium]
MPKKMLFNASDPEEIRAALMEDTKLIDFDVENPQREKKRNNIYKGHVVRVEPSLQAAFVDFGAGRHGFLPMSEIHSEYWSRKQEHRRDRPKIHDVLRVGQSVLVQVVREEVDQKGAALTTFCTLPGRYIVLMPRSGGGGVSRKIEDNQQRKMLRSFIREVDLPDGFGFIVRTAGMDREKEELAHELNYLMRMWKTIEARAKHLQQSTACLYEDGDVILRMLRDYCDPDVEEIWVDEQAAYDQVCAYSELMLSKGKEIVHFYQEARPLFHCFSIEQQIANIYERKVPLPSGGSIVIDPTEALVAIDVNSGRAQGSVEWSGGEGSGG